MGNRLDGKVCVITGAAQGIGQGCALEMAAQGGRIVVSDRNVAGGEETVRQIVKLGGEAIFVACDMRSRDDLEALMKAAAIHFGGIELLFNNAGTHDTDLTPHTAVHELPDEVWDMVCEVNLRSIWYGVRAALPYLRQ